MARATQTLRSRAVLAWRGVRNLVAPYEAGSAYSPRGRSWRVGSTTANNEILGALSLIRDRSRHLVRNNGYAGEAIEKQVTNIIGTGITARSLAPERDFRSAVQTLWDRWVEESDADGQSDFYGQQALAVNVWLEAGDSITRIRARYPEDGLSVPMQVQVLEPELFPFNYDGVADNGNRIRAGIEFDALGRRVAYHCYPSRPEFNDFDATRYVRVPADSAAHMFQATRAGQLRGVPKLVRALSKLRDLDTYDDATLIRQQLGNLFAGFVTRDAAVSDTSVNALTGRAVDDPMSPVVQLQAGLFQELEPGEDVKFSEPPDPPATYSDFLKMNLRGVAVAAGIPYELLTGDMSGVNDRTVRVILNDFKRRIQTMQYSIVVFRFCRPIWARWIDTAIVSGALPIPKGYGRDPLKPWARVAWTPMRFEYIHPVQDVQARVAEIRAGFTSRAADVAAQGDDVEAIDEQQAADNARADGMGLRYSSDARFPESGSPQPVNDSGDGSVVPSRGAK